MGARSPRLERSPAGSDALAYIFQLRCHKRWPDKGETVYKCLRRDRTKSEELRSLHVARGRLSLRTASCRQESEPRARSQSREDAKKLLGETGGQKQVVSTSLNASLQGGGKKILQATAVGDGRGMVASKAQGSSRGLEKRPQKQRQALGGGSGKRSD